MTAVENVELPMVLANTITAERRRRRAKDLLDKVGMGKRLDHHPPELSGGEQQRVTIARALANNPELLLLDEPTGDLDTVNSDRVMRLLLDLNSDGVTMIMVTHDVTLKHYAHRVVHMLDGKIVKTERINPDTRRLVGLSSRCNRSISLQLKWSLSSRQHVQSLLAKDESQNHAGARATGHDEGNNHQGKDKRGASEARLRVSSTVGAATKTVVKRPWTYREYGAIDIESDEYLEGATPKSVRRRSDSSEGGGGGGGYTAPSPMQVKGIGRGLGSMRKSSVQSISGIEVNAVPSRSSFLK